MRYRSLGVTAAVMSVMGLASIDAGNVTRQNATTFSQKVTQVRKQGEAESRAARRTTFTQDELNSWFVFGSEPYLPNGVSDPEINIVGPGRLSGNAVFDLETIAKRRSSGGTLDPWNLLGGRVPVTVEGILHTREGQGRFEVQSAQISGVPVPATFLQELLSYYSRSPERPQGVRLDDTFSLPSRIRQIEVGNGQAVVVQ